MKKTVLAFALLGILGAFGIGCGGATCESRCEAANDCDGATQQNCADVCADAKALVDASGCGSQYDKVNACTDGIADICDPPANACNTEAAAFVACVLDFCTKNPMNEACM